MAVEYGTGRVVTNGLVLSLDAADRNSYSGSGTTWRDMSGNGNNGTLGASTLAPTYSSNNGGYFDFNNDSVTLSDNNTNLADFTAGVTFDVWIYATVATNYGNIVKIGEGISDAVHFLRNSTGTSFGVNIGASNGTTLGGASNNGTWPLNEWRMISFTLNGSTLAFYSNGNFDTSFTETRVPKNVTRAKSSIAWNHDSGTEYLVGRVASVRIYRRGLTASEILQNYNATKSRFGL